MMTDKRRAPLVAAALITSLGAVLGVASENTAMAQQISQSGTLPGASGAAPGGSASQRTPQAGATSPGSVAGKHRGNADAQPSGRQPNSIYIKRDQAAPTPGSTGQK